eukprot:4250520-Amphidinium_carterae.1
MQFVRIASFDCGLNFWTTRDFTLFRDPISDVRSHAPRGTEIPKVKVGCHHRFPEFAWKANGNSRNHP